MDTVALSRSVEGFSCLVDESIDKLLLFQDAEAAQKPIGEASAESFRPTSD